jgi:hypothetical protein
MSSADDHERRPVFGTVEGRTMRLPDATPLAFFEKTSGDPDKWRVAEGEASLKHLSRIAEAVERSVQPPATRLEALAELLLELLYGEFVELAQGIADGKTNLVAAELARLIHEWAKKTARGAQ